MFTKQEGDCVVWTGMVDDWGYGVARVGGGSRMRLHRLAWESANGPIPAGIFVLHRCDNPPCMKLDHLFLGTNADNMADMKAKGRGNGPRGRAAHTAKLTENDVIDIRSLSAFGATGVSLARAFDVTPTQISYVVRGKSWSHLPI